jgi:diguanylate cyclase (GGDEF)-like protein
LLQNLSFGQDRLLIVDDDDGSRELLSSRLEGHGFAVDVAADGPVALEKIRKTQYDLVLLDYNMPGMTGLDLLRLLRATYSTTDLPVIMVTSEDGPRTIAAAVNHGANDYVTKPLDFLGMKARIESELSRARSARRAGQGERCADTITGLATRLMLGREMAARLEAGENPAMLLVDIDHFKNVTETFGYAARDQLLVEFASRLQSVLAGAGLAAQVGCDEFGILLDPGAGKAAAIGFAEMILAEMSRPIEIGGREICVTAGIGIVPEAAGRPEDILRDAALAVHRAQQLGGNRWHIFEPALRDSARERVELANDLRHAVADRQLVVFYQPKVDLKTGRTTGFEALLRWRHPRRGLLSPLEFIPIAEETGLIVQIGEWALAQSCRQLRRWQRKFPTIPPLTMNVNISVRQLADPELCQRVRRVLAETGIQPETLLLELTESTIINDMEGCREALHNLRAMRIRLKLDDFGTGYSSLACLGAVRFDSLKIDRSFIAKMNRDGDSHVIVDSIVKLAHALDMTVVAEGIEEEHQRAELLRMGCETGQGFLFSQPVPSGEAEAQLEAEQAIPIAV